MAIDYRKFKINSDYHTDNVVYSYSGTMTNGDGYYKTLDLTHSLPFIPLPFGVFSFTGNDGDWLPINFSSVHGAGTVTATASKISISINNYNGGLPGTVYIKIFAFAPSTYTGSTTPPTPISDFMINSEWTYEELITAGTFVLQNNNNYQTIYTHNLGYYPRVMYWIEAVDYQGTTFVKPSDPSSFIYMSYYTSCNAGIVTTTNFQYLYYSSSGNNPETLHYRIYGGQNA